MPETGGTRGRVAGRRTGRELAGGPKPPACCAGRPAAEVTPRLCSEWAGRDCLHLSKICLTSIEVLDVFRENLGSILPPGGFSANGKPRPGDREEIFNFSPRWGAEQNDAQVDLVKDALEN